MALIYICKNCEYLWESRKKVGSPPFCPKCRSSEIRLKDDFVKILKEKISEKFDKYLKEVTYNENSPYEYIFRVDDSDSKMMTKEELKEKLRAVFNQITHEIDPNIKVKIKLTSEHG
jgi:archaellin